MYKRWNPATLEDLDEFIRDIWVECCGHLSAFEINGVQYKACPSDYDFWEPADKSMNYKLKDMLEVGQTIAYEYDLCSNPCFHKKPLPKIPTEGVFAIRKYQYFR